ncbi:MAG TPA: acetyl-CoA hydrolase/transferase C-terminal domain-containing protein, partial [Povalibacter sp.]|nr:acetyl-CoA hydrolase/transferase C-terminal domain-containing protein [Povalibacter sp.]
ASNIVWNYGHTTIPRHLRDIVVTEYGIADLRGRTDCEAVTALVEIMDARFQDAFVAAAQRADKLPHDFRIPETARANRPELLAARFAPWRQQGLFAELPFGSEFTREELALMRALRSLASDLASWRGRLRIVGRLLQPDTDPRLHPYLQRMSLANPGTLRERIERRLVAAALVDSGAIEPAPGN